MKAIKILTVLSFLLLIVSCSSDDDSSSGTTPSTTELLTTSTWYQESKTPGSFSECEKNTSIKFNTNNSVVVEAYDDGTGTCESLGANSATYTLNGTSLTITVGSDIITANIDSISSSMLTITDEDGETVVFDKTQG